MIKGQAEIVTYDAEQLEDGTWVAKSEVSRIKQNNNIMLTGLFDRWYTTSSNRVVVMNYDVSYGTSQLVHYNRCVMPSSTISSNWIPANGSTPAHWELRCRFNPPGSNATYKSVSVHLNSSTTPSTHTTIAHANLSQPCYQTTSQIMDVFYRIYTDLTAMSSKGYVVPADIATEISRSYSGYYSAQLGRSGSFWQYPQTMVYFPHSATATTMHNMCMYVPASVQCLNSSTVLTIKSLYQFYTSSFALSSTVGTLLGSVGTAGSTWSTTSTDPMSPWYTADGVISTGSTAYSDSGTSYYVTWSLTPTRTRSDGKVAGQTVIQNTFLKTAPTYPYLDVNSQGLSKATLTVADVNTPSTESWSPPSRALSYVYRITTQTAGAVGTSATYTVARRAITGTMGNAWTSRILPLTHMLTQRWNRRTSNPNTASSGPLTATPPYTRHGQEASTTMAENTNEQVGKYGQPLVLQYVFPEVITIDNNGLTIVNIDAAVGYFSLDSTSSPALPVSNIKQVAVDSTDGTIYVACGNTGLWKITRTPGDTNINGCSISQLQPSNATTYAACHGVDIDASRTVYAVFGKELLYLPLGSSTWTKPSNFILPGVTDAAGVPSRIICLKVDPNNIAGRFFISAPVTANTSFESFWWSINGSVSASDAASCTGAGMSNQQLMAQKGIYCASDGVWYIAYTNAFDTYKYLWRGATANSNDTGTVNRYRVGQGFTVVRDTPNSKPWIYGAVHQNNPYTPYIHDDTIFGGTSFTTPPSGYVVGTPSIAWAYSSPTYMSLLCYVGKGVTLGRMSDNYGSNSWSNSYAGQAFYFLLSLTASSTTDSYGYYPSNVELWTTYDWNGTSWVRGSSASARLTSSTTASLIDGLTITFSPPTPSTASDCIANEMWYVHAYDGILKDNATTVSHTIARPAFQASTQGTTFSSLTVPSGSTSITTFPITPLNPGINVSGVTTTQNSVHEAGSIGSLSTFGMVADPSAHVRGIKYQPKLAGDFSIRFRVFPAPATNGSAGNTYQPRLALFPYATLASLNVDVSLQDFAALAYKYWFSVVSTTWDNSNVTLYYYNGTAVTSVPNITDFNVNDVWTITRTSGTTTITRNGSVIATLSASGDNATYGLSYFSVNRPISSTTTTQYASMNVMDLTVTTTLQDPVVFIGNNATTTGPLFDTKFSKCIPNFTMGTNDPNRAFSLYLNNVPVSLLYDGFADPAAGQAQITPDGMIRFNSADAGKSITGTWEYLHKIN